MPTYGYVCAECGDFEAARPIALATATLACPECARPAPRALASPHLRTSWAGVRYMAEARNEKSAHEPMTEHRLKGTTATHREAHAHAHHGHATPGPTAQRHGHSTKQRPWMIGH